MTFRNLLLEIDHLNAVLADMTRQRDAAIEKIAQLERAILKMRAGKRVGR